MTTRKSDAIDILKLLAVEDADNKWLAFVRRCIATRDIGKLTDVAHRLNLGMDDLAKKQMNTEETAILFIGLQKSIEGALKKIYRQRETNPLYDPKNAHLRGAFIADKQAKDAEFERLLSKNRW